MKKFPQVIISFYVLLCLLVLSALLFAPASWFFSLLLFLWGGLFYRWIHGVVQSRKRDQGLLQTIISFIGENEAAQIPHDDMEALAAHIHDRMQTLFEQKNILEKQYGELLAEAEKYRTVTEDLDSLCPVHIPQDIDSRWKALIEREWGVVNREALENLNSIKLMNEQNKEFVAEVIQEFGAHQETFESFSQKYRAAMEEYTQKAEGAKKAVLDELGHSSQKIEETFARFIQIEDITEKIKMISLNLSIEASKVRGSESFSLLARELRRLALSTEETTKEISRSIKNTVASMKQSREDQIRDITIMDTILQEFEGLIKEYDNTSVKLNDYIHKAISRISANQEEQKTVLLNFFKTLQRIAITKEELEHQVQYYSIFIRQTNEYVQKMLRNDKPCLGAACSQRRAQLEALAALANTDEERRMVNELFKELLGEDRESVHGTLSRDSNDFISF